MCVLIFFTTLSETLLVLRRNERDIRADTTMLIVALRDLANAPKNTKRCLLLKHPTYILKLSPDGIRSWHNV
jgi:hypothetical protein